MSSKGAREPKIQQLFVDASAAAQSKLIALIKDEGEFVSTTGGVVTLDLKSLLASVTAQLGLPDVAAKLPPEASSIEIMQSNELEAAQKGVNLLQTLAYGLTALTCSSTGPRSPSPALAVARPCAPSASRSSSSASSSSSPAARPATPSSAR